MPLCGWNTLIYIGCFDIWHYLMLFWHIISKNNNKTIDHSGQNCNIFIDGIRYACLRDSTVCRSVSPCICGFYNTDFFHIVACCCSSRSLSFCDSRWAAVATIFANRCHNTKKTKKGILEMTIIGHFQSNHEGNWSKAAFTPNFSHSGWDNNRKKL